MTVVDPALDREYEALVAECSSLAFRIAFSVLRQRQDAEDVAQEALIRAFHRKYQLRDVERLRGWLARIAWRLALDRRRSEKRRLLREFIHDSSSSLDGEGADAMIARERIERLWQAIDALPEKFRVVVVLASIRTARPAQSRAFAGVTGRNSQVAVVYRPTKVEGETA